MRSPHFVEGAATGRVSSGQQAMRQAKLPMKNDAIKQTTHDVPPQYLFTVGCAKTVCAKTVLAPTAVGHALNSRRSEKDRIVLRSGSGGLTFRTSGSAG